MWKVLANDKISVLLLVSLYEPGTLRLFHPHQHRALFLVCLKVFRHGGPPQVLSALI